MIRTVVMVTGKIRKKEIITKHVKTDFIKPTEDGRHKRKN